MYLPPFQYYAPKSLDEALGLLEAHLPDGKVLAGGQSLLPLMTLGLAQPSAVIDVNYLPDLDRVTDDGDTLRLGALVRHHTLEADPVVRARCPVLAEAAPLIGNVRVRHRGTLGGSLAHADPAAELPLVAAALGATIEVRGTAGARDVPVERFFRGYLETDLAPGEIVTGVRVPALGPSTGYGLAELVRRSGDFAIVAACAVVRLDGSGRCGHVSLAVGGIGPAPLRMPAAERVLTGQIPSDRLIQDAAGAVPGEITPESDMHGSADYRRAMARVMARRALAGAAARAGAGGPGPRA